MSVVLVINSGSSSFKYQLIEVETETSLASGNVERIGQETGTVTHTVHGHAPGDEDRSYSTEQAIGDHTEGFDVMIQAFATHGPSLVEHPPVAVGHRVVHGGARFFEPTVITPLVEINIDELSLLAPLHNPGALEGIRAAELAFPRVAHVAVFDTAFHQTLEPAAYTYAIDKKLAFAHRIRKYGFHGTSAKFVSERAAQFLGRPLADLKQIVFHLGNGASATAIAGGKSIDTSMGFTPLAGLVMGTRSGDIDPAAIFQLARRADMGTGELDTLLNKGSGLKGLAGDSDMRDIQERMAAGDEDAKLAFDVYVHRIRTYAGAFMAQLGGADVIVFTAGVGEHSPEVRAGAMATLGFAGVRIDPERNESPSTETRVISTDDSPVTVLVVPTNEELEIARQALAAANA